MATGLPASIVVEIEFTAGAWTDVSTSVVGDSIEITVGKDSPAGDVQPGTLDIMFDNADGTWTPDNPLSTLYPNLVEGKRIRVTVNQGTPSSYSTGAYGSGSYSGALTQSARFVGRITLIEPDFPDVPQQSQTRVTAVDVLGDLARYSLPPALYRSVYALHVANDSGDLKQFAYWPLRDGQQLVDMVNGLRMQFYQPAAGGEASWDGDSTFPGGGGALTLTTGVGLRFLSNQAQFAAFTGDPFGAAVKVESGSSGVVIAATDRSTTSGNLNGMVLKWDGTSNFTVSSYASGTATVVATIPAAPGWHYVSITDAAAVVDDTTASYSGLWHNNVFTVGGSINIAVRDVTMGLSAPTLLVDAGQSLTTATSDAATILAASDLDASLSWTSTVAGVRAAPPLVHERTGLDLVIDLANSQSGVAYVAYTLTDPQPITFVADADSRPTTVALTIDVEDDAHGGPTLDRNVYGKTGSATASSAIATVSVTDPTLSAIYGANTADRATSLALDNDLAAAASDLIAQSRDAKLRVSELTFDLATAGNDLYSNWFGLAPGERVRVANLPSTYFGVTYMDGYVLGWTERPGLTGYTVTLKLMPADAPAEARYNDATYGRFGWRDGVATVTSGTAVGTTATGTIVVTTASGPALTTTAGEWPMSFDWNGECVTVTSAPASSTSPQTLTITARGQNGTVARSHSAGEIINVWQSARFAL